MDTGEFAEGMTKPERQARDWKKSFRPVYLLWLLVPLLLWWSLHAVPFNDILLSIQQLHGWQLGILMLVNIAILLLFSLRWWMVIHSFGQKIAFLPVVFYRLAGFAVSYLTPGPQFGGEPLQVMLLTRRHHIQTPISISSVFLDKLLELLANFTFLVTGLAVIFWSKAFSGWLQPWMGPFILALLALPALHLLLLWRGKLPVTGFSRSLLKLKPGSQAIQKIYHTVRQAEQQIAELCQEHPAMLLLEIALSTFIWLVMVGEYFLMVYFAGLRLNLAEVIIALTLARLAFLVPLPGGLGALEASQVLAMQVLGINPAVGITLSLIIRARDLINSLIGLIITGWISRR